MILLNLLNNNNQNENKNIVKQKATITWNLIPNEILDKIFDLIPENCKLYLSKKNYIKLHPLVKSYISSNNYDSYIHSVITLDHSFVFERILNENISKWFRWKNYRFKSTIYHSYLYFIYVTVINKNANKCKSIFNKYLEEYFSSNKSSYNAKNWFKNNNIKNVKYNYE
jgi:hypothetical protein